MCSHVLSLDLITTSSQMHRTRTHESLNAYSDGGGARGVITNVDVIDQTRYRENGEHRCGNLVP
ncbi:hypothetical protein BDN72DRAFT_830775 [Pluteus cervinus]|uniref:Uncharacterized protein n=1 Tax=Pluteus cervinus TaxID=181527 RepID=A0ACD3BDR0_9AGAR|nr:hypothetical protein BDN72DRAFT_830775 [Pluteus cervinus]